jgi:exodeoxyribonuclease-5
MIWSAQQEAALQKVNQWRKSSSEPYFMLAGYAGTGKTTLAKHLAANEDGLVLFAAYTGKAAHVLRKTGIKNVTTIHQLIYLPRTKCDQRFRTLKARHARLLHRDPIPEAELAEVEKELKAERDNLKRPDFTLKTNSPLSKARLLVIDEYSMIDRRMGEDLLYSGCPILALGDPGQLPPVNGVGFFDKKPDVMLTDIQRQAADNPIIRMSMEVREGKWLELGAYGASRVISNKSVSDDQLKPMMLGTDQLLVGLNETRRDFNRYFRKLKGLESAYPVAGDKLVCLRNNHDEGLFNGQMWEVQGCTGSNHLKLRLHDDEGRHVTCKAHPGHFVGTGDTIDHRRRLDANEFDYGYALTVHKSQGSQWDNVVLMDEWKRADHAQWLYTGITRAAESVTVIR